MSAYGCEWLWLSADWCLGKIVGKGINALRGRKGIQDTVTGEDVSSGSLCGRSQLAEMTQRQSLQWRGRVEAATSVALLFAMRRLLIIQ